MLQIASIESFLGSLWFGGLALLIGYVAGHIFPISKVSSLISRKSD
jgi:hypothetical protein